VKIGEAIQGITDDDRKNDHQQIPAQGELSAVGKLKRKPLRRRQLNGVRRGHPSKMSRRQKQETPRYGLSGTHSMTNVENLSQAGPPGIGAGRPFYLLASQPPP
jgi:hypothetical protein